MMSRLSTKQKVFAGLGLYVLGVIVIVPLTGWSRSDNTEFQPQNEFKLDTWFNLGPFDFNKAVMYLIIAAILTFATMVYVAKRMQARPEPRADRRRDALRADARQHHAAANMDDRMARSGSRSSATLFLFICFSNLIGYIPLPTNTEHTFHIFGVEIPASPSTRRRRTSRSRSCSRSSCSSPTTSRASAPRASAATSRA